MGVVALEGIEFFAYHGVQNEERKIGNKYSVDINVEANFSEAALNDEISAAVNYELLYKLIKKEIKKPSKLLENIAHRIIEQVLTSYPGVDKVTVSISKFNPPIGGVCQRAKVTIEKNK